MYRPVKLVHCTLKRVHVTVTREILSSDVFPFVLAGLTRPVKATVKPRRSTLDSQQPGPSHLSASSAYMYVNNNYYSASIIVHLHVEIVQVRFGIPQTHAYCT